MGTPRIVTCTCSLEFYDTQGKTRCNRCEARAKHTQTLKAEWQRRRRQGHLTTRDGIFFCLRRKVRSVAEMANILNISFRAASLALDAIREDAR